MQDPDKDRSVEWLSVINMAGTSCLREHDQSSLDQSMMYLETLETVLRKREHKWDQPPHRNPPPFNQESSLNQESSQEELLVPWVRVMAEREHVDAIARRNNPYGVFDESDDDNESSSDEDETESISIEKSVSENSIAMRRLMIRILNAQSEILAAKATCFQKSSQWMLGAQQYTYSLEKIREALFLADSEISRFMAEEKDHQKSAAAKHALASDANIVSVAVEFLTQERDHYLAAAKHQEERLLKKLRPQWHSRDDVKQRMGDRWYNNPHPKKDYAALREEAERQLRDICDALRFLEDLDTSEAEQSAQRLKEMLLASNQRYNLVRPADLSRRVDINLYPDPTDFGWEFTGSSGVTEFFEKQDRGGDLIKLDWYYTTATVKTSLEHPRQGKTQLFAARVDPGTYRNILENPRAHTGKRYHQRRTKPQQHRMKS